MFERRLYSESPQARRVTRRRVLGTGIGVTAALGAAGIVGCGGGSTNSTATSSAVPTSNATGSASSAAQPKSGGVLNRVLTSDPSSFDLHSQISTSVVQPAGPIFSSLLTLNPHNGAQIDADLAQSIPESPDTLTYTFKLRPNVTFHDGTPLTSEDVAANYDWMINPPSGAVSSRQGILAGVDKIETPDAQTVVFKLKHPSASFLINQAVPYVAIGRKSQLVSDGNLSKNPVGTGPFKMGSYQPGVEIVLDRNPTYFKSPLPYLDGMHFAIIKDRNTLLQNFYAGRIDWTSLLANEIDQVQSRMGDKVLTKITPSNQRNHVFMNTTHPPFGDVRVRKALSLGLDRTEAMAVMDGGQGIALGSYMNPKGQWALPAADLASVPGYTEHSNIAEAKALLSAAGVADGTEINLLSRGIFPATAVYMVDQLTKLGFKPKSTVPAEAGIYAAGDSGAFDVFIWTAGPALDDPDAVMGDIGVSSAGRNWSKITVPEADAAYAKQTGELDVAQRKIYVNQADKALITNFATVTLEYDAYFWAWYPKVKNKDYNLTDLYTNMTFADVWLDD